MTFFADKLGYVLKFLYIIVNNYGVAIILFSILVKLLMLPLTIKQQKTLKKNTKMQEEMKQLQFKYKNDPEKLNQEMMAMYKREGMSPFSGCLTSIIQIILLFSVFILVSSPLTYMVKMDKGVIENMKAVVSKEEENGNTRYAEIAVIQYVKNLKDGTSVEEDKAEQEENNESEVEDSNKENIKEDIKEDETLPEVDGEKEVENIEENNGDDKKEEESKFNIYDYVEQANLNMDLFGIDLSKVPTQSLDDWKTWIIPVLYVVSSFISIRLTTTTTGKKKEDKKLITDGSAEGEEEVNPMADASKTMTWMMPIMSISIAIIAPLGLALYWLMNNVLMIIERIVLDKILDKEEEAEVNA